MLRPTRKAVKVHRSTRLTVLGIILGIAIAAAIGVILYMLNQQHRL